jgi:hypothetical protein
MGAGWMFCCLRFQIATLHCRSTCCRLTATDRSICRVSLRPPPLLVVFLSSDMACHWLWSPSNSNSRNSLVRLSLLLHARFPMHFWGLGWVVHCCCVCRDLGCLCVRRAIWIAYEARLFPFFMRLPRACTCINPYNLLAVSWCPIYVCTLQSRACYHLSSSQNACLFFEICALCGFRGGSCAVVAVAKRRSYGTVLVRRLVQASLSVMCVVQRPTRTDVLVCGSAG